MNAKGSIDMHTTNQGSSFAYHMKVTITPESLDKFADADWEDFNGQEIMNIERDVTRPHCFEARHLGRRLVQRPSRRF